jgi:transposase InsO family protein
VSRQCLSKWNARYATLGEVGLVDRSSAPHASPAQTEGAVVVRIETLRREKKWSARLIAGELNEDGISISPATVGRWLTRLGINRRRDLDPDGENNRTPGKITARYPGHMIHV